MLLLERWPSATVGPPVAPRSGSGDFCRSPVHASVVPREQPGTARGLRRGRPCLDGRMSGGQLGADTYQAGMGIVRLGDGLQAEVGDRPWAEDEAVGGAAELEVTELLAFADVVARPDVRSD